VSVTTRSLIGAPVARLEGELKVTGQARYAGEYPLEGMAYGSVVTSTIARGRVRSIDVASVMKLPGMIGVVDHRNAQRLQDIGDAEALYLQDDVVHYRGQAIAIVVATTLEHARAGAEALVVEYDEEAHDVLLTRDHPRLYRPEKVIPMDPADTHTGDVDAGLEQSVFRIESQYTTSAEHNHPMEPHAATVRWEGGRLIAYDSNQGAAPIHKSLAGLFDLPMQDVQVLSEHVGGGFGAKGSIKLPIIGGAMASKLFDRPVRVVLTRPQLFSLTGYRTPSLHEVRLGCDAEGHLLAVDHIAKTQTSTVLEFGDPSATIARIMYASPNLRTRHRIVALDVPTPRFMRGPGKATASFALESALDELAHAAGLDPVELRILNDTEVEPEGGHRFSSRSLVECLREGADRFGWRQRDPRPGIRGDGPYRYGSGVGCGSYPARSLSSTASATAEADGSFTIRITASDIGTGSRTILSQIAADALGVGMDGVHIQIGNSDFGFAINAVGSMGTSSWSFAVVRACQALLAQLADGAELPVTARVDTAEEVKALVPLARYAFGAHFAEVRVDIDTGEVRVERMVCIIAGGRIVNARTARSQIIGSMTWAISMALHEESVLDVVHGDYANHDFAGYHISAHADIPELEAGWVDEVDDDLNPTGVKGIGEVGIVGGAAAIANAVWHATGVRVRELPIRPDRVLAGLTELSASR
jgi:xanthine dehydrogenase YagR molybdenum-binding subunit